MSILAGDPTTQLAFSVSENKGVYALLLGSGLSRTAGIPTGWEITLDLVRRVALAKGVENQADWATWHRETTGEEPNYSALLAELAVSPSERRAILHSYIEPDSEEREEGKKLPTAAHRAIASLVRDGYIRVIITTNFDRLLENALREVGVEPTVVSSVDTYLGAEPIVHSACYILKLHGDYKDTRILNTDEELRRYPAQFDALLDRIFDDHGLITCGWSGDWDHALRAAINRRYPMFWGTRGKLGEGGNEIVKQRKAVVTSIVDADSFFAALGERVKTLLETRRQNPLSIDLLVETVKRYLSKPEYRIRLDENISEEAIKLLNRLDDKSLSLDILWNAENFQQRVYEYEAATEPLARSAGVLGRWGDGAELPLITETIRAISTKVSKDRRGGQHFWMAIRTYPAVLIMTAYCLGAARGQRWKQISALLSSPIQRENREPERIVDLFFLWNWDGFGDDIWNNIKGFTTKDGKRKTPLSDHIYEIFTVWGKSFVGIVDDFERLFDRFEVLGSIAHLDRESDKTISDALSDRSNYVQTPIGRIYWSRQRLETLIAELSEPSVAATYIAAGFAKGEKQRWEMTLKNIQRAAAYLSRRY